MHLAEHAAGVVDQDVDVPALARGLPDETPDGLAIGHIQPAHMAVRPAKRFRLSELVFKNIAAPDDGAGIGEGLGDRSPETVGGTGHCRCPTREIESHVLP